MLGDIDLLIRDDTPLDLSSLCLVPGKFDQPYSARTSSIKVDLYSIYGSPFFRYNNLPLFPFQLGHDIINSKERYCGQFYIPSELYQDLIFLYLYTYGLIRTHNVSINNAELKFQDRNYLSKAVDILRNRFNITTTLSNFYQKAHDLLYHYGYSPPLTYFEDKAVPKNQLQNGFLLFTKY